jgi:apolipoprotein N-acyltransferase
MTTFVDQGADFISILTNDSWWYYPEENGAFVGSQLGYLQHFNYARLRAIENRRYIARSANTGISGFIDAKGDIVSTTEYWQRTALTDQIKINDEFTFYTKNGDFIGRIMLTIALILILSKFVSNRTENFKYRN